MKLKRIGCLLLAGVLLLAGAAGAETVDIFGLKTDRNTLTIS